MVGVKMATSSRRCPTLEELEALANGATLTPDIKQHLVDCEQCRQNLRAAQSREALAGELFGAKISIGDATRTSGLAVDIAAAKTQPALAIPGYTLGEPIGSGGQGFVYHAVQETTRRPVAVKVLSPEHHASEGARKRFEREIEIVATLRHPNLVSVLHAGAAVDGRVFLAMEYVDGVPLRNYVRERDLPLEDILELFVRVCDGVQYAHHHGVIHRDLKPANILVEADGTPRVLDFGLARRIEDAADERLTLTQQVMGTLPYMSPEQAQGLTAQIDTRTDVYSLGVVLYELLTGQFPYSVRGRLMEVIRNIVEAEPATLRTTWSPESGVRRCRSQAVRLRACPIDHDVQTMILRALSKDPARRYQSAGEFGADVRRYLRNEPIEARRDSTWYMLRKLAGKHVAAVIIAASLLVTVISAASIAIYYQLQARDATQKGLRADAAFAAEHRDMVERFAEFRDPVFHAFLAEWRADRPDAARFIAQRMNGPEAEAARFLLAGDADADALLASIPADKQELAQITLGEWHAKAGRSSEARAAFERALAADPDGWWSSMLKARLESP